MKQVRQRTALIILLIALLAAGMALFYIFYFVHGADWASFSANAHAYTDGTLTSGEILDREEQHLHWREDRLPQPSRRLQSPDRHHDRRSQALSLDRQFPQRDGARPLKRAEWLRRGL